VGEQLSLACPLTARGPFLAAKTSGYVDVCGATLPAPTCLGCLTSTFDVNPLTHSRLEVSAPKAFLWGSGGGEGGHLVDKCMHHRPRPPPWLCLLWVAVTHLSSLPCFVFLPGWLERPCACTGRMSRALSTCSRCSPPSRNSRSSLIWERPAFPPDNE
jgi:hypothetical protein